MTVVLSASVTLPIKDSEPVSKVASEHCNYKLQMFAGSPGSTHVQWVPSTERKPYFHLAGHTTKSAVQGLTSSSPSKPSGCHEQMPCPLGRGVTTSPSRFSKSRRSLNQREPPFLRSPGSARQPLPGSVQGRGATGVSSADLTSLQAPWVPPQECQGHTQPPHQEKPSLG